MVRRIRIRIPVRYFKENWGAPFIMCFILLLLVCAGLSIQGNAPLANEVAVYSYCFLVAGVVLQLASFLKFRNAEGH
jgi:hypothetical protein